MDTQPTFTDETVLDLPTTDPTSVRSTAAAPAPSGGPRRTRRLVAGAVAASLALGVAAAVALGSGSGSTSSSAAGSRPGAALVGAPTATTVPGVPTEVVDAQDPAPQPPAPEPPAPEPQPAPGILAVSTNAIHLPAGVFSGSFTVRNDGGSPVDWTWAAGDFGIAVDVNGSTLQPGESIEVHFTINPFQQPVGEFLFANSIYNDDVAKDIWIYGEKKPFVVNPDIPQLDLDLKTKQ